MASILIRDLPTYTGDTSDVYFVMNDSGNTTTYKVLNSSLTGPLWSSAGMIQIVGWGATTSAPTIGTTTINNVSLSKLGSKQYQVVMSFQTNGSGASAGNGDYLFTLPNGLDFDTTKPWQTIYTGNVLTSSSTLGQYTIPSGTGMVSDNSGSISSGFTPIVWDFNRFRLLAHLPGTAIKCIGSNFFPTTASFGFQVTFQFTSQY